MRHRIPDKVNVLLVGGGGREHALAWAIGRSERLGALWTTHPQNPGLAALARPMDAPFIMKELYRTEQFCRRHGIGLVVVGPEEPLAQGIADRLSASPGGPLVFGPGREAALLEADKAWAKRLMRSALVPTAEARFFRSAEAARDYLESREEAEGHVVKAAGLAKGKGVIVCRSRREAVEAVHRLMTLREAGDAADEVLIEERLDGPEVSVFALTDGRDLVILDACQDHKRLLENDEGPNTGGMGAFSPSPLMNAALMSQVQSKILVPTIDALRREGVEYRGMLYAGLMLTHAGPKVLEFNVRFGDPETQALLPRMKGDILELLWCCAAGPGALAEADDISWDGGHACCIVLASPGYPGEPRTGLPITGVEEAASVPGVRVFHAGTAMKGGLLVTAGGRVLNVVGTGATLREARESALEACGRIHFEGMQMRRDIGANAAALSPA